jgi:hypothetical protein
MRMGTTTTWLRGGMLLCALGSSVPLGGCKEKVGRGPNPCNAAACDILEPECQETVMAVLRCFRGGDEDVMPDVEVITEDEYIELVKGEEPTEEELLKYERFSRAMALLRLAPEISDMDADVADYASEIAAAYITRQERVVIIDRGMPLDSQASVATFTHELVHALQDREIGLEGFYDDVRPTLDASLAARALVEGEATHYDLLMYAAIDGAYPAFINWDGYYGTYQIEMLINGYEDEAPLALSFVRFPYAFGGDYVTDRWLYGGQNAVAELYETPPQSTADVITLSELTESGVTTAAQLREVSQLTPIEGYETVAYDELGSFIFDGFLHRMEVSDAVALDLRALYVIADGATVLYNEADDHVVAAWRLRFDQDAAPDEDELTDLREALGAPDQDAPEPGDDVKARVLVDDRDLIIIASDAPLAAEFLGEDVAWQAAPSADEVEEDLPTAARWHRAHF